MSLIRVDRSTSARRLGYTAAACPLRRRVMVFEVWEHRRRVRITLVPIESWKRGEPMLLELRDTPDGPGRSPRPMFDISGLRFDVLPEALPVGEMAARMGHDPRTDADEMRADDLDIRGMLEGSEPRLHALVSRLFDTEFAVYRALESGSIDKGRDESISSVLAVVMILCAGAASVGAYLSEPWWPYAAAVAMVALAATVWRVVALPRRFARRTVLPVLIESLAMLAPTLTELELVVERGRDAKLAAAKLLRERDLRAIVASGEGASLRHVRGSRPPPPPPTHPPPPPHPTLPVQSTPPAEPPRSSP